MAKTYFISDLHLSENQPKLTELFVKFMEKQAISAEKVYILGDLFDFWIGDDEHSPLIEQVKLAILQLTQRGIPCYFMHGNRDFLIGKKFAKETGLQLLGDYQLIDLYGTTTLLCHGDTLCIDDVNYQQFRRKVQQKWRQRLFLCLPLTLRLKIAQKIRAKSQLQKRQKSLQIMDINPDFTCEIMAKFNAQQLIHGHTHRENIHQEQGFTRIVLGDWKPHSASILMADKNAVSFVFSSKKD